MFFSPQHALLRVGRVFRLFDPVVADFDGVIVAVVHGRDASVVELGSRRVERPLFVEYGVRHDRFNGIHKLLLFWVHMIFMSRLSFSG